MKYTGRGTTVPLRLKIHLPEKFCITILLQTLLFCCHSPIKNRYNLPIFQNIPNLVVTNLFQTKYRFNWYKK